MQTAPTIIFIGTNAQIRTTGGSNYTFIGDMVTADPRTHIVRFLELSNYVAAVTPGSGSLTTNANQFLGVPLSIKDSALFTNTVNFGAGFLGSVTNILTAPQFLGTNVVFDGSISSWFQFNPRTGPETNYVFTNIQAGQTILVKTYVTNGTTVRLWANTTEIPAAWYVGNNGTAANINSNTPSVVYVSRDPLVPATNVTVWTRDLETVAGANITFTTNFPAGTVTMASGGSGGGESIWTNEAFYARLIAGSTNSLKVMTNGLQGIFIGDTNVASAGLGWPFDGLTYMSILDGDVSGHGENEFIHGNISTVGKGIFDIESGNFPYVQLEMFCETNAADLASKIGLYSFPAGAGAVFRDQANENLIGFQNVSGVQNSIIGDSNMMRLKWSGFDRFIVQTNGDLTLVGVTYRPPSAQGSVGTVLTNNGSGVLGWGTGPSGASVLSGTTNFFNLSVQAAKLPATNYPAIDGGWPGWETVFCETNAEGSRVNLSAAWQFMVPTDYATNSLKLLINYSLLNTNGPNASNVVWGASILAIRSGTTNNVHTNLFGSVVKGSNDWIAKYDGTNIVTNLVIDLGVNSLLQARDLSVIKLERFPTEDTYGGAVAVHGLQLEYTRP